MPPPPKTNEQELSHRRDLHQSQRRRRVSVSGGGLLGQTIDFLLTAKRDAAGAKRFLRKALSAPGNCVPRVINVDKNPAYPPAVDALKTEGLLPRRVRLRQCKYLNNVVEQDHRTVKKRA
jgi:transposase-like protein